MLHDELDISPETLNDAENLSVHIEAKDIHFIKSYEQIKQQLEKAAQQYNRLSVNSGFSESLEKRLNRLATIQVVLSWVLRDDDAELL